MENPEVLVLLLLYGLSASAITGCFDLLILIWWQSCGGRGVELNACVVSRGSLFTAKIGRGKFRKSLLRYVTFCSFVTLAKRTDDAERFVPCVLLNFILVVLKACSVIENLVSFKRNLPRRHLVCYIQTAVLAYSLCCSDLLK